MIEAGNLFLKKSQTVNIFSFVGHMVCHRYLFCHCSVEAATDNTYMHRGGHSPLKLYLQTWMPGYRLDSDGGLQGALLL